MSGSILSRHIYLVGFMGAGKTTVGEALARELSVTFTDLDHFLESETGLSIVQIFAELGEPVFRRMESEALLRLSQTPAQVISLGGGTFCRPEAVEALNGAGITIWLDCPFSAAMARCRRDHHPRPLAANEAQARILFEQRRQFYSQAHLRVATGDRSVPAVLHDLLDGLRWLGEPKAAP